jgi:hypothetical protein
VARPGPDLEPGEELRAYAPASFRGAAAASSRSTMSLSSGRVRSREYEAWAEAARAAGFPTAGPEMVLGLTDSRLVVWRVSFWMSRPSELSGDIPIDRLADVVAVRHGPLTGVAFVLDNGSIIEVEAFRGRALRQLAAAARAAIQRR